MRQRAETDVDIRQVQFLDPAEHRQIQMPQMRIDLRHLHPGLAVGRERGDLQPRMGGDQADEFGAGIAGRPENGSFVGHRRVPGV